MTKQILGQAITAIKAGNKNEGGHLLRIAIQSTEVTGLFRAIAFLWFAEITDNLAQKLLFYEEALIAAPTNLDVLHNVNVFLASMGLPQVSMPPPTVPGFIEPLPLANPPLLHAFPHLPTSWSPTAVNPTATAQGTSSPSLAHHVEQNSSAELMNTGLSNAPEDIEFTHFYPSTVAPGTDIALYVYIHLPSVLHAVVADFKGRKEFSQRPQAATEESYLQFKRGTIFTIIPHISGARSIPERADVAWEDDFECVRFTIKTHMNIYPLLSLAGTVNIYLGSVIIAQLPLVANVAKSVPAHHIIPKTESRFRFKRLFISYSHQDRIVIKAIDHIYKEYPEMETYIDFKFLQASDYWWPEIQQKIQQSEAFQLFWSVNSAQSVNVANEWRYALGLPRPIVPILLRPEPPIPMPMIPAELQHIHFEDFDHFIERL